MSDLGAAAGVPNLDGKRLSEVDKTLRKHSFKDAETSTKWRTYKHQDRSKVSINKKSGRVVRTAAPRYRPDGSKINKGQRVDKHGKAIDRKLDHAKHPKEKIRVNTWSKKQSQKQTGRSSQRKSP